MSVKLDGFMRPYRGRGDDLDVFWSKFMILAKSHKWDTGKEQMANLPLLLDKAAYTVFNAMPDSDKEKPDEVKKVLTEAFAPSAAECYRLFKARSMGSTESVDEYAAELKRLLKSSGHNIADDKDPMLLEQFVGGLPRDFAREVRIQCSSGSMTLTDMIKRVRAMSVDDTISVSGGKSVAAAVKCYSCKEPGHVRRNCPKAKGNSHTTGKSRGPQCYSCKEYGHIRRNCPKAKTESASVAVSAGHCQAGVSTDADGIPISTGGQSSKLLKVDVCVKGHDDSWISVAAVVDTGCTRSLMKESVVTAVGLADQVESTTDWVVGIDGTSLESVGSVAATVQQHDDIVQLPELCVDFLVVSKHEGVDADLILGNDVASAAGGLEIRYQNGSASAIRFGKGPDVAAAAAGHAERAPKQKLSRHISVERDSDGVTLSSADFKVRWDNSAKSWTVAWVWGGGVEPTDSIGSGVTQYSRKKLSAEQEQQYQKEVQSWIDHGWMVPHDPDRHGKSGAILPLMAVCQGHKASTPVRPCLDYRRLNEAILSHPGGDAPACDQKIREWRRRGGDQVVVDIKKAFLQVHVDPSLVRYQTVVFNGVTYVMERMAFGLSIAPKVMDAIVKFALCDFPDADNYVDDVVAPSEQLPEVTAALSRYGLPTKPPEVLAGARVLGMQLSVATSSEDVMWRRRDGMDLTLPEQPTKREVFSWCGRLTSHYPVASWLRPCCSYIKRVSCEDAAVWDKPVSAALEKLCRAVEDQVSREDPVNGKWTVKSTGGVSLWCDASNLALGVVISEDGSVIEDHCWLRPKSDKRHINVAELDAVLRGLSAVVDHRVANVRVMTDSKTVHGWLKSLLGNIQRVKVNGLYRALVERRLQLIDDLVEVYKLKISVEWVPSQKNLADRLTRVPASWLKMPESPVVAAATQSSACAGVHSSAPLAFDIIRDQQGADTAIQQTVEDVNGMQTVRAKQFQKVAPQLRVRDGVLYRSIKLPPANEACEVPVIPSLLEQDALRIAHENTGHGSWEVVHEMMRQQCYLPGMARKCQEFVGLCDSCAAANPAAGGHASPTRPEVPARPWQVVAIDTLELGPSRAGFHCVLVCTDMFTRYVEVIPLKHHDAKSVAEAFASVCCRWGPPEVVRSDNGTEFVNAVMDALYLAFGVEVKHGAVRHPQSQGSVERFNRTLLTLIRKVHSQSNDWKTDLSMLLYFYRVRPHGATGVSPQLAMTGWQPRGLVVEAQQPLYTLPAWTAELQRQAAAIRDLIDEEMASADSQEDADKASCCYGPGDVVMMKMTSRAQKRLPKFQLGWRVKKVLSESTVVVQKVEDPRVEKIVNVELLKRAAANPTVDLPEPPQPDDASEDDGGYPMRLEPGELVAGVPRAEEPRYVLRNRAGIRAPVRYD